MRPLENQTNTPIYTVSEKTAKKIDGQSSLHFWQKIRIKEKGGASEVKVDNIFTFIKNKIVSLFGKRDNTYVDQSNYEVTANKISDGKLKNFTIRAFADKTSDAYKAACVQLMQDQDFVKAFTDNMSSGKVHYYMEENVKKDTAPDKVYDKMREWGVNPETGDIDFQKFTENIAPSRAYIGGDKEIQAVKSMQSVFVAKAIEVIKEKKSELTYETLFKNPLLKGETVLGLRNEVLNRFPTFMQEWIKQCLDL